ncbi:MAG: hypothetical protein M0Z41_01720 [Peptococcaceae bacterium]|nr:hypothetical protein [Peptococcaceae bacterium]
MPASAPTIPFRVIGAVSRLLPGLSVAALIPLTGRTGRRTFAPGEPA